MQCIEAKHKPEKGRWCNGVNKKGRDYGEDRKRRRHGRGVEGRVCDEKWKKKILGSRIRSTQDQCLGGEKSMETY